MKYISAVVGVLISIACGFLLWRVLPAPGHAIDKPTEHIVFVLAGGIFFGALLIIPTIVVGSLKSLFGVIGPYLPVIGGRRASDPPAPPPEAKP